MSTSISRGSLVKRMRCNGASIFSGGVLVGAISVFAWPGATVLAAGTCDPIPYLAQGSSQAVGVVTVTATVNTSKAGPGSNTYWHDSDDGSLTTTWSFSASISEIQLETQNHDDTQGSPEVYTFIAKDASGDPVGVIKIQNQDGTFRYSFPTPVKTIELTYKPESGVYGSYLLLSLPSEAGACGVAQQVDLPGTVRAPSGSMTAGATPPTLTPTAFVTGSNPETPVSFDTTPTCVLEDGDGYEVELSPSTPAGVYTVVCSGGEADGYTFGTYLDGEFVIVEAAGEYEFPVPQKWWDALHTQELPHTR